MAVESQPFAGPGDAFVDLLFTPDVAEGGSTALRAQDLVRPFPAFGQRPKDLYVRSVYFFPERF